MCTLDHDFASLIDGIENDYALTLAQKGISLNLEQIFEQKTSEQNPEQPNYAMLLNMYSEATTAQAKLEVLDELEFHYNTWCNNKSEEELNFKSAQQDGHNNLNGIESKDEFKTADFFEFNLT